ncbi:MAG TPA: NAD(P)-binding protein [Candidatus Polarisedimenticolia bacterium]|nr:NAD(P)-binding protein [Candidatus Polarisedimenticolia bacterium]
MTERRDEQLGMRRSITRRDFLYGMPALAGLMAACRPQRGGAGQPSGAIDEQALRREIEVGDAWYGPGGVGDYAPSHGNTPEVLRVAHQVRDGLFDGIAGEGVDGGEEYDLVIVGGGLAGLAAAHHFRRLDRSGRCLILDNHPIFGGEAKRNEFNVAGHHLVAPQGSNDFGVLPETGGPEDYFTSLGIPRDFEYARPEGSAAGMRIPLDHYAYLHWQADQIDVGYRFGDSGVGDEPAITGLPRSTTGLLRNGGSGWGRDPWSADAAAARWDEPMRRAIARWRDTSSDELEAFLRGRDDPPTGEFGRWLDAMTVKEYYEQVLGLPPDITAYVDPILASIIGLGCDAISAWWGWHFGLPGFRRVSRYTGITFHCFPGGNTGIARYFVKNLIPDALGGTSRFADIITAPVDFAALDRSGSPVRMRCGATVVRVKQRGAVDRSERVVITYVRDGSVRSLTARAVVMAAGGWMNRRVLADLPATHHAAYGSFHHSAVLVANVALTNWRFLQQLGAGAFIWQGGFGFSANIRRPMRVGEKLLRFHPDDPVVLTFYVPYYFPGLSPVEQGQLGRIELLSKPFDRIEREIREQMLRLFGETGFDPATDIAGIILNRWGHAYVNPGPGFMFGSAGAEPVADVIRQPFGRIAIGHSELHGHQNWIGAAAEGRRAVEALLAG